MSTGRFQNATPLRVGMKATFDGKDYRLRARLVLGMEEDGETYYWDEFEMVAANGDRFFLEYDEGQWRRLDPFEPEQPLSTERARRLRVSSRINLDGHEATVTQMSAATVYVVDGKPTWQARVGDRSFYVDAHRLNRFYAVEWNDDGIEHYRGGPLSRRDVYRAFGLSDQLAALETGERRRGYRVWLAILASAFGLMVVFCGCFSDEDGLEQEWVSVPLRQPPPAGVDTTDFLAGHTVATAGGWACQPTGLGAVVPLALMGNEPYLIQMGMPVVYVQEPRPGSVRAGSRVGWRTRFFGGGGGGGFRFGK
jgi:hypothetical protein